MIKIAAEISKRRERFTLLLQKSYSVLLQLRQYWIVNVQDRQAGFFKDRISAGRQLAAFFKNTDGRKAVIYALPRGGVVIAAEISKTIKAPLDLIITRKLGHPLSPEYAIGAVAENGHSIFNIEKSGIPPKYLKEETAIQRKEAKRRRQVYLGTRPAISAKGKIAILVDDGLATGLTMKIALKELKVHYNPTKIIVAVPVAPRDAVDELESQGVKVVCILTTREFLGSIGSYYQDFSSVEDSEVKAILKETERFYPYEESGYSQR